MTDIREFGNFKDGDFEQDVKISEKIIGTEATGALLAELLDNSADVLPKDQLPTLEEMREAFRRACYPKTVNASMTLKDLLVSMIDNDMDIGDILKVTFTLNNQYATVEVKITECGIKE